MNSASLWVGIAPLIAFVIADSFFGLKTGLVVAAVLAVAEAIFSWVYFGHLDSVTLTSVVLVLLLSGAAYWKQSEKWFLFQPVVLSAGLGAYLIISYLLGHPILWEMSVKYKEFYPPEYQQFFDNPMFVGLIKGASFTLGPGLLCHAAATAYAAMKLNKWWWIAVRGIGFYVFAFASMIAAKMFFV